jgi:ATP-dependent Zn protease
LFETKPYARRSFIQQVSNRKSNSDIAEVYGTIKDILENRAIKGAMTNKLNATSTIFHLKNNYKWVDKQEIDQTTKQINYTSEQWENMSDDELEKLANE